MSSHRLHAYFYLLIAALIWGIATIVLKFTLTNLPPLLFLSYRLAISSGVALLLLPYYKKGLKNIVRSGPKVIIYSVLSTAVALGLLFLGLERSTVLDLSLITLTGPLLIAIGGVIFLKEKISKREKTGAIIAFLGTTLSVIEPIFANNNGTFLSGNIFLVGYLVVDVASTIFLKKLLRDKIAPFALTNLSFVIGFLTLLPVLFNYFSVSEIVNTLGNTKLIYHAGVLYMAIFSGTIAYTLRAKGEKTIEVGEAGLFGYLTPIFSAILALAFLGEQITLLFVAGGIVVFIGVALAEYKKPRKT